jgi:hypothetical protein
LAKLLADNSFVRESLNVSIIKFKNQSAASKIARQLLKDAKENEPLITKDVKQITTFLKAKMIGLRNKFKSESSLARKLQDNSILRGTSLEKEAKRNNDTLRYTILFSPDNYNEAYNLALVYLDKKSYKIQKLWNAWDMEGKSNDTGYRGINATIISSQEQKFELQFHTESSFRLKTETHIFYQEQRKATTSRKRRAEIAEIMKSFASEVETPKGI